MPPHPETPPRTTSWSGARDPLPKAVRQAIHRRDKTCQGCGATSGLQVDHVVNVAQARRLGWTDEQIHSLDNLQLLCDPCHDRKTGRERALGLAQWRARGQRPQPRHPGLAG